MVQDEVIVVERAPTEVLIESREWLRTLAVRLLGDSHRADDIVHDTLLRAWEEPTEPDDRRGWLAQMIRRRAWVERRSEARRRQRERVAARAEALPAAAELAERVEIQRRVIAAVGRLPEPYRHTILLRYYEGIPAVAIAERLGLSASAIRSRLQRGLAQLRSDLSAEFGSDGKASWGAALGLLAEGPSVLSSSTAGSVAGWVSFGGWVLVMKKFAAAAAIVLALILGYQGYRIATDSPPPDVPANVPVVLDSDPGESAGEREVIAADERAGAVNSERVVTSSPEETEGEEPTGDAGPPAIIKGRIWRTDGMSLEGARVIAWAKGRPGGVIDAEGLFTIETWVRRGVTLFLEQDGTAVGLDCDVRPLAGQTVDVEIEVDVGHTLVVEVIDKVTRLPVTDLRMAVRRGSHRGQASMVVRETDHDGFFRCGYLPEDDYALDIDVPEYQPVKKTFRVPATDKLLVELEVAPQVDVVLENYELHPRQKSVHVAMSRRDSDGTAHSGILSGTVDDRGRFRSRSPGPGVWNFNLLGSESVHGEVEIPKSHPGEIPTIVLTLPQPGDVTVVGWLVDEDGEPLVGGVVRIGEETSPVDEDGRFTVERVKVGQQSARWIRGQRNDRVERPLGSIEIPDRDVFEHTFTVLGSGRLTMGFEGLPKEMLAGLVAFSIERIDGGDPPHSSYGVKGAHQKLTLDYLPHGRYRVSPNLAHEGSHAFSDRGIEIGEDPLELVIEYRPPVVLNFEFEFPTGATPARVTAVLEQDGRYIDTYFLRPNEGRATEKTYRDGTYTCTFKAAGFPDVVRGIKMDPEVGGTYTIRFTE